MGFGKQYPNSRSISRQTSGRKAGSECPILEIGDNQSVIPNGKEQGGPAPSAEQIFDVLVRQNAAPLLAFIRSMVRNEALVDDVFQETMMVAWRRLDDYDKERPFGPWLRGIAHRVSLAQFRKHGREHPVDSAIIEVLEDRVNKLEEHTLCGTVSTEHELTECIGRLPQSFRDAIEFVYRGDRSVADAATAADVGVEAMKKRLQRARAMLAECLRGKGIVT